MEGNNLRYSLNLAVGSALVTVLFWNAFGSRKEEVHPKREKYTECLIDLATIQHREIELKWIHQSRSRMCQTRLRLASVE